MPSIAEKLLADKLAKMGRLREEVKKLRFWFKYCNKAALEKTGTLREGMDKEEKRNTREHWENLRDKAKSDEESITNQGLNLKAETDRLKQEIEDESK